MIELFAKLSNIYTMMYSSEYQIMKYFSVMLFQNLIP